MTRIQSTVVSALLALAPAAAFAATPASLADALHSSPQPRRDAMTQAIAQVAGTEWSEQKVGASDGVARDVFGFSVAIEGDTALVGAAEGAAAPTPPAGGSADNGGAGAVYVFTNQAGTWTETAKLTADGGIDNDQFGYFVALHDGVAVVGAPRATVGGNALQGAAYVFTLDGGSWTQTVKLVADDGAAGDQFGWSLAFDGSLIAIGARGATVDSRFGQGAVYVFSNAGSGWTQQARLVADDGSEGDQLGVAVAVHAPLVLAGAPNATIGAHGAQGAAYLFDTSAATPQVQKIAADDGAGNDSYGFSLAFDGSHALVSAPFATVGANAFQDAVYAYALSAGAFGDAQKLTVDDGAGFDVLGIAVALDGDDAVFSAPFYNGSQGKAYFFHRSDDAGWTQQHTFLASDAVAGEGAAFGYAAGVSQGRVLIGQSLGSRDFSAGAPTYEGAAYFYAPAAGDTIFRDGFDGTP